MRLNHSVKKIQKTRLPTRLHKNSLESQQKSPYLLDSALLGGVYVWAFDDSQFDFWPTDSVVREEKVERRGVLQLLDDDRGLGARVHPLRRHLEQPDVPLVGEQQVRACITARDWTCKEGIKKKFEKVMCVHFSCGLDFSAKRRQTLKKPFLWKMGFMLSWVLIKASGSHHTLLITLLHL